MYIAFEKDPNRDGKRAIIVFVLCLVFFALAFKCSGQVCEVRSKPYANYPNVTRISACEGIGYEANGKSIFVGIFADSIKPYKYIPILYVVLPNDLKISNPELLITFDNGEVPTLIPQINDIQSGYIEFSCKDPYFFNIRNNKINMIQLVNNDITYTVYEEKMDLFYKFTKRL